jgi:hypothetical protein
MTSQDITSTGSAAARAVIDQMTQALGGRLPLESAAAEMVTATGWRRHPGWGTEPSKPEAAADFTYMLVNDLSGARYRLVPTALDYTEKGDGSAGQLTGVDFMFDPRPVDMAIPAWRVAARVRPLDMTSPLRLARKLTERGADVTLEDGEAGGSPTQVLVLREPGRPATRVHVEVSTGLPVRVTAVSRSPRSSPPTSTTTTSAASVSSPPTAVSPSISASPRSRSRRRSSPRRTPPTRTATPLDCGPSRSGR